MGPILETCGLTVALPMHAGWVRPVNEVSVALKKGETLGVVGESGSGKTMLALALMGLLPPGARCGGEVWLRNGAGAGSHANASISNVPGASSSALDGRQNLVAAIPAEMRAVRGRRIAMIFQEPTTALNPVVRVGAQIAEAIRVHETSLNTDEIQGRVIEALERAAVPEPARRARQYPHELSGGLRQRVMIAIALAAGPDVLIADEPTTALDVTIQKQILDLLAALQRELQLSLLFITHDLGVVAQVAGRVAVMYAGRIVEGGPASDVLRYPAHPYTEGLLRAAPRLGREKLAPIPGAVPPLDALPPGCAFAPRCNYRIAECEAAVPQLVRIGEDSDGHRARCILARGKR